MPEVHTEVPMYFFAGTADGGNFVDGIYPFAYIARFQNSTKEVLRNSAIMTVIHIPKSLALLAVLGVGAFFGMADTAAVFDHSGVVCMVCRGNLRECLCELYQGRGQGRRERRFFVKGNF